MAVHLWQNGKNMIRSYCYGTSVTAQRQAAMAMVQRNFSGKQLNSYGAYVTTKTTSEEDLKQKPVWIDVLQQNPENIADAARVRRQSHSKHCIAGNEQVFVTST